MQFQNPGKSNQSFATGAILLASFFPATHAVKAGDPEKPGPSANISRPVENLETPAAIKNLALPDRERALCSLVFHSLETAKAQEIFLSLAERKDARGQSMLLSEDSRKIPLYKNIAVLTSMEFHPRLAPERASIVESFLKEISDPGQLNQASWGVCATGLIYVLYEKHPSEATRLLCGLVSPKGNTTLQDGTVFERAYAVLEPDKNPGRTRSEQLMMSGLMERANGTDRYCNACDENFDPVSGTVTGAGLSAIQTASLYRAVLNQKMSWYNLNGNSSDVLMREVIKGTPGYVPVAIEWTRYQNRVETPRRRHIAIKGEVPSDSENAHHILVSGTEVKEAGRIGSHFCLVTRVESDRVYFRNLHGPSNHENGTELTDPPRRVEDNTAGIESMTVREFKARVHRVYVPE